MTDNVIKKCQYCESTDLRIGYQQSTASIMSNASGFSGSKVEHILCGNCGSVLHSRVKDPRIFKKYEQE